MEENLNLQLFSLNLISVINERKNVLKNQVKENFSLFIKDQTYTIVSQNSAFEWQPEVILSRHCGHFLSAATFATLKGHLKTLVGYSL